jgi:hypothetical protein
MQEVYFAATRSGPIKIGFSTNVISRLAALRTAASEPIDLIVSLPGGRKTELYLHSRLTESRANGEWFHPTRDVLRQIDLVKSIGVECIPQEFRAAPSTQADDRRIDRSDDVVASALEWMLTIAEPIPFGERMADTIKRVADCAGVSARTLKAIWYSETDQLKAETYVGLKDAFEVKMAITLTKGKTNCQ